MIEKEKGEKMEIQQEEPLQTELKKKDRSFTPYVLGGLLGALFVTLLTLFLFTYDLYPFHKTNSPTVSAEENRSIAERLTTETTSPSIDELAKAIVGVIPMQQRNIWEAASSIGSGSGIIYKVQDDKAYIVTNHHVVEGAQEVEVEMGENTREKAKVLGSDPLTDLAVLEINQEHVEYVASFGDSENLQIGEPVLAIGNPLSLEFSGTVTKGIVSGLDRALKVDTNGDGYPDWITEVIQTDAAINPGNSGGALINKDGKVVGINSMKIAQEAVEGIGFAIPVHLAKPIIQELEENGKVMRPFVGITPVSIHQVPLQYQHQLDIPKELEGGMVIASVQENSPAANAQLQPFDILTKVDEQTIQSMIDLRKYLYSEVSIGDSITIEFYRKGEKKTATLQLDQTTE